MASSLWTTVDQLQLPYIIGRAQSCDIKVMDEALVISDQVWSSAPQTEVTSRYKD